MSKTKASKGPNIKYTKVETDLLTAFGTKYYSLLYGQHPKQKPGEPNPAIKRRKAWLCLQTKLKS